MRSLVLLLALMALGGCMNVSDMGEATRYHMSDAGLLDHSNTQRSMSLRLQPDSFIFIAQGAFVPPGGAYPRPNVVAEEAFKGFVEYFPLVRRAQGPIGLEEALGQARAVGAHYLLYTRFARADDRIGNGDEWYDQQAVDRLGIDTGTVQMMLIETSTRYLIDTARIRSRGGLLTFHDNKPEDLLGPPLEDYARALLGLSNGGVPSMADTGKANDLLAQIPKAEKGLPPVHLWNPDFCGDIDMRIARDGTWFYLGTPIGRKPMVRLFSTIIRRDGNDYFLVTPVEKVGIKVDDAPFVAVALDVQGDGEQQVLGFTSNVEDRVEAGPEHPLRFVIDPVSQEPSPYVHMRANLEALIHRNVFYELVELAVTREIDGESWLGVWSSGEFYPIGQG